MTFMHKFMCEFVKEFFTNFVHKLEYEISYEFFCTKKLVMLRMACAVSDVSQTATSRPLKSCPQRRVSTALPCC